MLTKKQSSGLIFLEVKHFCIWRQIKSPVEGCETIEVQNPKTKETLTKYGYRYDTVAGFPIKLEKYDTGTKYGNRYFGFKLHLADEHEIYVLDLPYHSQVLRRLLRAAPNIDWSAPLSITAFKAHNKERDDDETAIWLRQDGETVKAYYTKADPHDCPQAEFDKDENKWDFRAQHRWLVRQLEEVITPMVEATGARYRAQKPAEPAPPQQQAPQDDEAGNVPPSYPEFVPDDDVPF